MEKETIQDTENGKKKKSFWKDKKNVAIVILSLLLFCGLASSDTTQIDKINQLNSQISELNQQIQNQDTQITELKNENDTLQEKNKEIKSLKTNNETLVKEKEELEAKLSTLPSTEEIQKTIDEKNSYILNLESQIGALTAEKSQVEAQNGILQQQLSNAQQSRSTSSTTKSNSSSSNTDVSTTVYITNTGNKYHRDGCSYLRSSQISISKNNAISQGYTACSRCNP